MKKFSAIIIAVSLLVGTAVLGIFSLASKTEGATESVVPVYSGSKEAKWTSSDTIQIDITSQFEGTKNINNGNVLFLGSLCNRHGMDEDTVMDAVNALSTYANVDYRLYNADTTTGDKTGTINKGSKLTGISVKSSNHNVAEKIATSLYTELITNEKKYDLIVLEFDGSMVEFTQNSTTTDYSYYVNSWKKITEAQFKTLYDKLLSDYYSQGRCIWVVPDQKTGHTSYAGDSIGNTKDPYPYIARPVYKAKNTIDTTRGWFNQYVLNGATKSGTTYTFGTYTNPNQVDYNNSENVANFLTTYVINYYGLTKFTDKLANDLTVKYVNGVPQVHPQYKNKDGVWCDVAQGTYNSTSKAVTGGTTEDTYGTKICVTKLSVSNDKKTVEVEFNTILPEIAAANQKKTWGHDLRVLIDCDATEYAKKFSSTVTTLYTNNGDAEISFSDPQGDYKELDIKIAEPSPELKKPLTKTEIKDQVYNGTSITPSETDTDIYDGNKKLSRGTDYTISCSNNRDVTDSAVAHITFIGDYATYGEMDLNFKITPATIVISGITAEDKVYDGNKKATIDQTDAVLTGLIDGDDVELASGITGEFADANVGEDKKVTLDTTKYALTGDDAKNYVLAATGHQTETTADITPKNHNDSHDNTKDPNPVTNPGDFKADISDPQNETYNDVNYKPELTVKDGNTTLTKDVDYELSYSDIHDAGTATVTVTFKGNYAGTSEKTFEIAKKELTVDGTKANDKSYDKTTDATLDTTNTKITGIAGDDEITLDKSKISGTFAQADVKDDIKVTLAYAEGYISGEELKNYTVKKQEETTADITPKTHDDSHDNTKDPDPATNPGDFKASIDAINDKTYTASEIVPEASEIVVRDEEGNIIDPKYYDVKVTDNIEAGDATVTVTFKGNYAGEVSTTFKINPKEIVISGITAEDKEYDQTTDATIDQSKAVLTGKVEGDDLTLKDGVTGAFTDPNAGENKTVTLDTSKYVLEGEDADNYILAATGQQSSTTADITPKDVDKDQAPEGSHTITYTSPADRYYNGSEQEPTDFVIKDGATTLTSDDYSVKSYKENIDVTTNEKKAKVVVEFKNNYKGELEIPFNILPKNVPEDIAPEGPKTVEITPPADKVYTGKEIEPEDVVITDKETGKTLVPGVDYDIVEYYDNINATEEGGPKARIKITFKGNYTGDTEVPFNILPLDVPEDQKEDTPRIEAVDIPNQNCEKKPILVEPLPEIYDGETLLLKGRDYDVSYVNNDKVGDAVAVVTFKGNYKGTMDLPFKIVHKNLVIAKGKAPGIGVDGWKDCYYCTQCDEYFEDADMKKPIADYEAWKKGDGRIPALPKMGDDANLPLWISLFASSVMCMGAAIVLKKKEIF